MKIYIDAGHNYSGYDTGATGNGLREQDVTFQISDKLNSLLQNAGVAVKMSRDNLTDCLGTSLNSSLLARSNEANAWGADLFISIHCNAGGYNASGTETYCYNTGSEAYKLAEQVQKSVVGLCQTKDRGVKTANFAVLKNTKMPAILVETAFITNAYDAEKLKDKQELFAKGIYKGVLNYMGITVEENKTEIPWYNDAQWFVEQTGISDGTRPNDNSTRAESWQMIYNLFKYIENNK